MRAPFVGKFRTSFALLPLVYCTRCSARAVHRRCGTPVASYLPSPANGVSVGPGSTAHHEGCCAAPGTHGVLLPIAVSLVPILNPAVAQLDVLIEIRRPGLDHLRVI